MRILIVDDESLNRFLLVHMLEEAGYTECYEAESGREAIELAEKIEPDLVLLDVMMPDLSGFEVAPRLKHMAGDIYLPVIFITALDDQESLVKCLEVGGDDFASKPFDKVILTAKIRAHSRTRLLSKKAYAQNQELKYYRAAVEREHAIVEHIFANALTINETVKDFFDYRLAPASSFNGDLFVTEPSPAGGIYFLMGDFTGHGLASAIGALPVTRAFQAMASKGVAVSEMASTINETLLSLLPGDMFFAASIVEISAPGDKLTVWTGGMPDLIVISPDGEITKQFGSMHMALGVLDADEFESDVEHYEAQMGDRLVGYSDGVIEMTNTEQQMLGEEALFAWLQEEPGMAVLKLNDKIDAFRGDAEQLDDITLVTYTCQDLSSLEQKTELSEMPFTLDVCLNAPELRKLDPVYEIIMMIGSQPGMQSVRADLSTVLSELFNNALDHGLLGLDSKLKQSTEGFFEYFDERMRRLENLTEGQVRIQAIYRPHTALLEVEVKDSGDGFDYQQTRKSTDTDSFGRGIPLIRELCHTTEYSDGGTRVTVTFKL